MGITNEFFIGYYPEVDPFRIEGQYDIIFNGRYCGWFIGSDFETYTLPRVGQLSSDYMANIAHAVQQWVPSLLENPNFESRWIAFLIGLLVRYNGIDVMEAMVRHRELIDGAESDYERNRLTRIFEGRAIDEDRAA